MCFRQSKSFNFPQTWEHQETAAYISRVNSPDRKWRDENRKVVVFTVRWGKSLHSVIFDDFCVLDIITACTTKCVYKNIEFLLSKLTATSRTIMLRKYPENETQPHFTFCSPQFSRGYSQSSRKNASSVCFLLLPLRH